MSKSETKTTIAIFPKVVQTIAAVLCLIDLFLPWLSGNSLIESMPYSSGWVAPLVVVGAATLIFSVLVLATRSNGLNIAGNIIGILGGIFLAGEVLLQVAATSADYYQIALWLQLVLGIVIVVFSIVSLATTKKVLKD